MAASIYDIQKALEADGFYPGIIQADSKIQRFKRDQRDKGHSAWYVCHRNSSHKGEEFYVVVWGDWHEQGEDRKFVTSFTQNKHDKQKIEEFYAKVEKQRRIEQERVWEECAKECQEEWESLSTFGDRTEYSSRKKLSGIFGCRTQLDPQSCGRAIFVPVRDTDEKLWGFQTIFEDGTKRFSKGLKKRGNFFVVGGELENPDIIYLAEGFSTAASIHMALDQPIVCCFDAGNLEPVGKNLRSRFPQARFVVCGDDDRFKETGNTGRQYAEAAAKSLLGRAVFPTFKDSSNHPTDFNDLHCSEGVEAVRSQLLGVQPAHSRVFTLGHLEENYYYITSSNQQITAISASGHTKHNLLNLMPMPYWESQFPAKMGVDWDKAFDFLMTACRKVGVFQPEKVRGVGVWLDNKRVVVNLGDQMWIDGELHPLNSFPSKYTYQIGQKIAPPHPKPLSAKEASHLLSTIGLFKWKRPEFAMYLAGFLVIAPLAGILPWRPHLWLNGPSGSGKSWVMETIVNIMFSGNRYYFLGNTTEAGIRQTVRCNARPIIFDEFEVDDEKSGDRVGSIIELFRQASSQADGFVVKGGATGKTINYRLVFCAIVASIRVLLKHEQDKNRFTQVELLRNDPASFPMIEEACKSITEEFADRLFSRSVRLAPVILENMKRFQLALSEKYNSRFGQQYGSLLAGYASLMTDDVLSREMINDIVESVNLTEESEVIEDREEGECISHLTSCTVMADTVTWGPRAERSIAELIRETQNTDKEQPTINRMGLKVHDGCLYVANSHPYLARLYRNTKWADNWKKSLSRLPGAQPVSQKRFGNTVHRCISLPLASLLPKH